MRIEDIEIRNYRSFREVSLRNLPQLAILVGPNGSGKSTLFDSFGFLKDAMTHTVATAVGRRGGFEELVSRGAEGPMAIRVQFGESGGGITTYHLEITARAGRVVVAREVLRHRWGPHGKASRLVDFREGDGYAVTNESRCGQERVGDQRRPYRLADPSALAIKGLGQFRQFPVVSALRSRIENWHISPLDISHARRSVEMGYAEQLSISGDNVAQVAEHLHRRHPERFARVLEALGRRIPGASRVKVRPMEDGGLALWFGDESFRDPFSARFVSDGTIKMFVYLLLLYAPAAHPLLVMGEPENHLHPDLLPELVEEFRDYARRGGQVFVSTHSPCFLNGAGLEEVFWFAKADGFTSVRRVSTDDLLRDLVADGERLGMLWRQGLLEGAAAQ